MTLEKAVKMFQQVQDRKKTLSDMERNMIGVMNSGHGLTGSDAKQIKESKMTLKAN